MCPVPIKGGLSIVSYHRPMSLLNTEAKAFERFVLKYLFNHLRDNNLLSSLQSGFIPSDSTVNQLTFLYNTFCQALNSGKEVRVVFCDISKAFDRVWHVGLLHKHKADVSLEKSLIGLNIIFRTESNALLFMMLFLIGFLLEPKFLKDLYLGLYYFCCILMI